MLNQVFKLIKQKLSDIEGIKIIDWFNDQYGGIIHTEPGIFLEFVGTIQTRQMSKEVDEYDVRLRVHLYSKLIMKEDKSFDEAKIDKHFELVEQIYQRLQGYWYESEEMKINSLQRVEMEHHQYLRGWFVTTQDYAFVVYRRRLGELIERPRLRVISE